MRDDKLEQQAESLYDSALPYHNFEHIRKVLRNSEEQARKCRAEGISIDEEVVYYALLFHDAGYHEDHQALGFDSKEAYSAQLADQVLSDSGMTRDRIGLIKAAILCTHCDAHCTTTEEKIVRAADLSELGADYRVFKDNTLDLKNELEIMSGRTISWDEWRQSATQRIELFLREDLDVTSDYYDAAGQSIFHQRVRDNLKRLMSDENDAG